MRPQSAPVGHSTAPRTSRVAADVLVRDIPKFVGESKQATSDAWGLTAVKEEPPSIATHRVTEPEPELKLELELELEPQAQGTPNQDPRSLAVVMPMAVLRNVCLRLRNDTGFPT